MFLYANPFGNSCQSIRQFMPENFMPAMATIAACLMGANYLSILKVFGCCGVPMLTGALGSCKSEAAKCGLALFGAHESHCFNNQSTPSYLLKILNKTTIPVVIDDITARAADTWEELFIDAYNGTSRGTRSYGVESFSTLPIVSSNWKLGAECPRAHSRAIHIGFNEHTDEPEANLLYAKMQQSRDTASASIGEVLKLGQQFLSQEAKEHINNEISPAVSRILATFTTQARFTTTMSIFMHFFLKVCSMHVHESVPPHACKLWSWFSLQFATLSKGILFSEEDYWDFFCREYGSLHQQQDLHHRAGSE